jgi:hypothetical protein
MLTFRLRVVHCLPSANRLEEYVVPDAFWPCAESRSKESLRDPNAIHSAMDTTQTRIGPVLCLTLAMNDLHAVTGIQPSPE